MAVWFYAHLDFAGKIIKKNSPVVKTIKFTGIVNAFAKMLVFLRKPFFILAPMFECASFMKLNHVILNIVNNIIPIIA